MWEVTSTFKKYIVSGKITFCGTKYAGRKKELWSRQFGVKERASCTHKISMNATRLTSRARGQAENDIPLIDTDFESRLNFRVSPFSVTN